MKQVLFIFTWVLLFAQLSGQSHNFSGAVYSTEGQPLVGANVYFENSFSGTVTDADGVFIFTKLAPGSYILQISYIGFEIYRERLTIKTDTNRVFYLQPVRIIGEEAVVSAVRAGKNDPFAVTDISSEDISRNNSGKDIPFLLAMSPSLVPTSDAGTGIGYTGFRIRGTDAFRVNITMNGVPLNDAESHGVWWVNMPDFASSVENMQIQRGVGTSSNGAAAFGASINIQTLALNNQPYAQLSNSVGSYNTRKHSVALGTGLINDRLTLDFRLSSMYSDGYIERAFSDLNSYYISAGWHTGSARIKLVTFSGDQKTYQAWDGVPGYVLDSNRRYNGMGKYTTETGEEKYYDNETDNYKQSHYQLHYLRELSPGFSFNTVFHYTRGKGYYEQYKENGKLNDYLIPDIVIGSEVISKTDLIRRKWLDNDFYGLVFSTVYRKNRLENIIGGGFNIYEGDHYGDVIWARNAGISKINHRWYTNTGNKKDFNLFGKINYKLTENFYFYSDLQLRGIGYEMDGMDDDLFDISQEHNYLFFNPKIGWNYIVSDKSRVFFSFAVANREPNRSHFKDAKKGDPVPLHETLYDYESGYNLRLDNWALDVNLFYMDYNNQLVLTGEINDVGDPVMKNVKNSYRVGTEIISALYINNKVRWNANMTLSRNKINNIGIFVDNWDYWNDPENEPYQYTFEKKSADISFSPSVVASSNIDLAIYKDISLLLQSKYIGKQYIDNSGSEARKLDPYFVNDLIINYSFANKYIKEALLSFSVLNIFNTQYISNAWIYRYFENKEEKQLDGFFPQAGTHFLAGLTLNF